MQITKARNFQKWLKEEARLMTSLALIFTIFMERRRHFFQGMWSMSLEMWKMRQNVVM